MYAKLVVCVYTHTQHLFQCVKFSTVSAGSVYYLYTAQAESESSHFNVSHLSKPPLFLNKKAVNTDSITQAFFAPNIDWFFGYFRTLRHQTILRPHHAFPNPCAQANISACMALISDFRCCLARAWGRRNMDWQRRLLGYFSFFFVALVNPHPATTLNQ